MLLKARTPVPTTISKASAARGEKVQDLLDALDLTVAPLVGPGEVGRGEVHLRVTTRASTPEEAEGKIEPVAEEILSRLSEYYLG